MVVHSCRDQRFSLETWDGSKNGFGARLVISGRVIKHCLYISREICTVPSLYRPSTDGLIVTQGLVKCVNNVPIVTLGPVVTVLGSVLEVDAILME